MNKNFTTHIARRRSLKLFTGLAMGPVGAIFLAASHWPTPWLAIPLALVMTLFSCLAIFGIGLESGERNRDKPQADETFATDEQLAEVMTAMGSVGPASEEDESSSGRPKGVTLH